MVSAHMNGIVLVCVTKLWAQAARPIIRAPALRSFTAAWLVIAVVGHLTDSAEAEVPVGLAAPLTGPQAWGGAATQQGAEIAVADLNAAGGVLGERVQIVSVDDYCAADQAVVAAHKLVEARVEVVFGHKCSSAALAASRIYSEAGILMIATFATNPALTEEGFTNVFRLIGRDDVQGRMAADLLAERFADRGIAIMHDNEAYGRGLAEETRARLLEHGLTPALFRAIEPRRTD